MLKHFAGRLSNVCSMPYIIHSKIKPILYILGCKIEKLKPFDTCVTGSKPYPFVQTFFNKGKKVKVKVLLLYSVTRPDSFSSALQPYCWQGTHPTLV